MIAVLGLSVSMSAAGAQACPTYSATVQRDARRFAPVLEFAPGETYFPVVPFFTAFEIDRHFAYVDPTRKAFDWSQLDTLYHRRINGGVTPPKRAAVFYSHEWLDSNMIHDVWVRIRSDNQAQRRAGIDSMLPARIELFKYVYYYVNDVGLEGHAHDIEKTFVFIVHPPAGAPASSGLRMPIIIIGAGHTKTSANNVSVITGAQAERIRKTPGRIGVLVELGGHGSAPDIGLDGQFDVGTDVNWFLDAYWGSRDVLAISGQGFTGRYQSWMTMRRNPEMSVTLKPFGSADSTAERVAQRADAAGADSLAAQRMVGRYTLLPMTYFHSLDSAMSGYRRANNDSIRIRHYARARSLLDGCIRPYIENEQNESLPPMTFDTTRMNELVMWLGDGTDGDDWYYPEHTHGRAGVPLPWHDGEYLGEPEDLLKAYLHRPASFRKRDRFTFNWENSLLNVHGLRVGVQLGIPDAVIHVPGITEFQFGWQLGQQRGAFSTAFVYDNAYRSMFSWYFKVAAVDRRDEVEQTAGAYPFAISGGLSAMIDDHGPAGILRRVRIRIGPRVEVGRRLSLRTNPARWDLNVSIRAR